MMLRQQWVWRLGAPAVCGYVAMTSAWAAIAAATMAAWLTWRWK